MSWTPETWPIGAALLPFANRLADGTHINDADSAEWRKVFRALRREGFEHIDLMDCWVRAGDLSPERQIEFMSVARDEGIGVAAISTIRQSVNHAEPDKARANYDYAVRSIDAAANMGVKILSIGLHQELTPAQQEAMWFWHETNVVDHPEQFDSTVKKIQDLADLAAGKNVELSLEIYEDTFVGTADESVKLVRAIDRPNVGLNPDVGNLIRLHRPVEDWRAQFEKMLPYTNYWHMKNYSRDYDPATGVYTTFPLPMEFGYINYRAAIAMALELGFEGPICTEHYGSDSISVMARNRDYVRRMLAAAMDD